MAGFEKLAEVRAYNTAAAEAELERQAAELGSLAPARRGDRPREGVPLELWQALQR